MNLTVTGTAGSDSEVKTNYIMVMIPTPTPTPIQTTTPIPTTTPTETTDAPPIANFTANITNGPAPLPVSFTDASSNTPTAWNWSFTNVTGNNTQVWFSTIQNPVYTFGIGNYSIVLNAGNSAGYDLSNQVTFINVTRFQFLVPSRIGVFRNVNDWLLDYNGNGVWDGPADGDRIYITGQPGDIPVPGDWNGDLITEIEFSGITIPGMLITMVMVSGTVLPAAIESILQVNPEMFRYLATGTVII